LSTFTSSYSGWFTEEIKYRISSGKMLAQSKGQSFRAGMRNISGGKSGGRRGGQLWRVAQGSRAAFFKKIRNAGTHSKSQLAGQMAYINGKAKEVFGTALGVDEGVHALDKETVSDLVESWSGGWRRDNAGTKNGHTSHMVVSFPDDVTDAKVAAITKEWCQEIFESRTFVDEEWEYYAALHTDTANPHVHIVINNRGVDEGKWFYLAKDHDLNNELLKELLVDISEEHGVFLDSASRIERGKLTYAPPKHEFQQAKRLGVEPVERAMPPAALARAKEVMAQYAAQAEAMAEISKVMEMPNLHDALVAAAVNLRDGQPVDVSTFFKEEELVQLDLTQHPVDIRQAIVKWSADNADRIANAEPTKRDRFVKDWFAALDAIDKSMDPDTDITFGEHTGQAPTGAAYRGTFVAAAIGDEERLVKRAEQLLINDRDNALTGEQVLNAMRSGVQTGTDNHAVFKDVMAQEKGRPDRLAVAMIELFDTAQAGGLSDAQNEMMFTALPVLMKARQAQMNEVLSATADQGDGVVEQRVEGADLLKRKLSQFAAYLEANDTGGVVSDALKADVLQDETKAIRTFVASGKFGQFMMSGQGNPDDKRMVNVVGTALNRLTDDRATEPLSILKDIKARAADIGLNPDTFAQRVLNGAFDARMEREWMVDDLRHVGKKHGLDGRQKTEAQQATAIAHEVYDFVGQSIQKLHSNHIQLEPPVQQRSVSLDVEKDHTAFVERSRETINMIRVHKTAVFDTKGDELAFLRDFKEEFGEVGIKRLATGDIDVIKDLGKTEQERRDIAYTVFRLFKRNPSIEVEVSDVDVGLKHHNPTIWHGQGGHSI
jgi:hypothetical protein